MTALLVSATETVAENRSPPEWLPTAALIAGVVALFGLVFNRYTDRNDRRRGLYADAYRWGVAWVEMLYRVRRRDPDDPYSLATQFHEIQEHIDFHQGWIDAEDAAFGRAYRTFVKRIKDLTFEEIKQAWKDEPCDPKAGFSLEEENHPPVEAAKETFIADLRDHMSPLPWKRRALSKRYPETPATGATA